MISAADKLAPNFTAGELNAQLAPDMYLPNLRQLAQWLQVARGILGVPMRITSGWRSAQHNFAVGGSPSSSHLDGHAADFVPIGLTQWQAWRQLSAADDAGLLPPFDQIIYYPIHGHIHVGLGTRLRREVRIRIYEGSGGTPLLTRPDTLPGAPDEPNDSPGRTGATLPLILLGVVVLGVIVFATSNR